MGCSLEVDIEGKDVLAVRGNNCMRGEVYAQKELTHPERTLTCTVAVTNGKRPLVTAKTAGEVPKARLMDCMEAVRRLTVKAPVNAGDILVRDLLQTGVNLVACEDVPK